MNTKRNFNIKIIVRKKQFAKPSEQHMLRFRVISPMKQGSHPWNVFSLFSHLYADNFSIFMFLIYSSLLNHRFTCPTAFLLCPFGCLMGISILACPTRTDTCTGIPPPIPSPASSIACPFSVNSHFILPVAQANANMHPFTLPHLSFVWLSTALRVKAESFQGFPWSTQSLASWPHFHHPLLPSPWPASCWTSQTCCFPRDFTLAVPSASNVLSSDTLLGSLPQSLQFLLQRLLHCLAFPTHSFDSSTFPVGVAE